MCPVVVAHALPVGVQAAPAAQDYQAQRSASLRLSRQPACRRARGPGGSTRGGREVGGPLVEEPLAAAPPAPGRPRALRGATAGDRAATRAGETTRPASIASSRNPRSGRATLDHRPRRGAVPVRDQPSASGRSGAVVLATLHAFSASSTICAYAPPRLGSHDIAGAESITVVSLTARSPLDAPAQRRDRGARRGEQRRAPSRPTRPASASRASDSGRSRLPTASARRRRLDCLLEPFLRRSGISCRSSLSSVGHAHPVERAAFLISEMSSAFVRFVRPSMSIAAASSSSSALVCDSRPPLTSRPPSRAPCPARSSRRPGRPARRRPPSRPRLSPAPRRPRRAAAPPVRLLGRGSGGPVASAASAWPRRGVRSPRRRAPWPAAAPPRRRAAPPPSPPRPRPGALELLVGLRLCGGALLLDALLSGATRLATCSSTRRLSSASSSASC